MKKLVFLLVGSVFLGTQILAIDIGIAKISIYRLLLSINLFYLFYLYTINSPQLTLSLSKKENQYRFVYALWLFFALISVLWASNTFRWMYGLFFVGTGIVSILLISIYIRTVQDIKKLFIIVFTMIVFHHLIGWIEVLFNHYFWANVPPNRLAQFSANQSLRMPYSIFTNINDYSTLIFSGVPLALIILFNTKRLWLKIISVSTIFSTILLLIRTGSRGNQLAFIVFVAVILLLGIINRKISKVLIVTAGIVIVSSLIIYFASSEVRFLVYSRISDFFKHGGSNVYRINMILNGFIYLIRSFGLGVGAGNIEHWLINQPYFAVDAPNIHNWFLDILIGYGVIPFIAYLVMYVHILRQLYVSFKYHHDYFIRVSSLFLFAYVVSFIFSSMSSASNIFIEWQWVYWGMLIAFTQLTQKKDYEKLMSEN